MNKLLIIVFFICSYSLTYSQNVEDNKEEYNIAIKQANTLFKEKKYSASIYFYKKAQKLNPDARLPKYRLEDIVTIFIDKEIADNREDAKNIINEMEKRASNFIDEKTEYNKPLDLDTLYTQNTDLLREFEKSLPDEWKTIVNDAKSEMPEYNDELIAMNEQGQDSQEIKEDNEPEDEEEKQDTTTIKQTEPIVEQDSITEEETEEDEIVEDQTEDNKADNPVIEQDNPPKEKSVNKNDIPTIIPIVKDKKINLEEEKIKRDKELKEKYPETKTVEHIERKNKKITRVIINKENKITVYLEVKHNWGGKYYFIDNSPYEVKSISKTKFLTETR